MTSILWQGDCLEELKNIADGSIDLILCDPPYGTTQCKWDTVIPFEPMWSELKRVIKPNGAIALFGSEPFSSALRMSNIKQFKYDWYWNKNKFTNHLNAKKQPMRAVEVISVFYFKQPLFNITPFRDGYSVQRSNKGEVGAKGIWGSHDKGKKGALITKIKSCIDALFFDVVHPQSNEKVAHSTQKPVALLEYLIKTYTLEGETVLDFTMGSGSTGVAAKNLNRNFIGIEKDPKYFEIARERILG